MTRKQALVYMTVAGLENDQKTRCRLLIEARVNRQAMNEAWVKGYTLAEQRKESYDPH